MFILDQPYVSDYLKESIIDYNIPVLKTPFSEQIGFNGSANFVEPEALISKFKSDPEPFLYTNSENAITWIHTHLGFSQLANKIDLFKDKIRFRKLLEKIDPGFFYREIKLSEIDKIDIDEFPEPFVIKPAVGFFSLGVFIVEKKEQWQVTRERLKNEVKQIRKAYPSEVLDTERFIIEEVIEGTEFAFDAFFNEKGEPVIISLLKHLFASGNDVSDRVYISSKEIIETYHPVFTGYLKKLNEIAGLKNFPLHVEMRIDEAGNLRPVEINPLRTGGWCTTADMTGMSFGFNPYKYLYNRKAPNWEKILENKEDKIFSNIVLTNSGDIPFHRIKSFDYEKLANKFNHPIEIRPADYKNYFIFGFLFAETHVDDYEEIEWILNTDFRDFIRT